MAQKPRPTGRTADHIIVDDPFGEDPKDNPTSAVSEPEFEPEPPLSDTDKINAALGTTVQPMAESLVKAARLNLADISAEEQLALAVSAHETIGKAAGYIPEFGAVTENMKAAYLKIVRDIWIAAQRKARSFNE